MTGTRTAVSRLKRLAAVTMVALTFTLAGCGAHTPQPAILRLLSAARTPDGGYAAIPAAPIGGGAPLDEIAAGVTAAHDLGVSLNKPGTIDLIMSKRQQNGCFMDAGGGQPLAFASAYAFQALALLGSTPSTDDTAKCFTALDLPTGSLESLTIKSDFVASTGKAIPQAIRNELIQALAGITDESQRASFAATVAAGTGLCIGGVRELRQGASLFDAALAAPQMPSSQVTLVSSIEIWASAFVCSGRPASQTPASLAGRLNQLERYPVSLRVTAALAVARPEHLDTRALKTVVRGRAIPEGGFALLQPLQGDLTTTYLAVLIRAASHDATLHADAGVATYVRRVAASGTLSVVDQYKLTVIAESIGDAALARDIAANVKSDNISDDTELFWAFATLTAARVSSDPSFISRVSKSSLMSPDCNAGATTALITSWRTALVRQWVQGNPKMCPDVDGASTSPEEAYYTAFVTGETDRVKHAFDSLSVRYGGLAEHEQSVPSLLDTCYGIQSRELPVGSQPATVQPGQLVPSLASGICVE